MIHIASLARRPTRRKFFQDGEIMANPEIGSLEWARMTGGNLRRNERMRLLAQAMLLRLAAISARGLHRIGISRAEAERIDLDSIRLPDTRAARDALELCTQALPTFLLNHCVRTYLWGALLARRDKLLYDEELFYVASLLHDLGLTDQYRPEGRCACFAMQGAQAAQRFAQGHRWPEHRQHALTDAICLHLNVRVSTAQGMEAHLLHEGASLDVVGARYSQIHGQTRDDVLKRYPRAGFKKGIASLMKEEGKLHPASRAGFLVGLGMNRLIRGAPFSE